MIESLFPEGVVVAALRALPEGMGLLPEEEPFVARAVEKRRREFTLGRVCAREALRRLGAPAGAILVSESRAPVWPEGVVGSISHCAGLAAAAVARRSEYAGIGIDLEPAEPVDDRLFPQIATERERSWLASLGPDRGEAARLLFSAKESVYKGVSPIVGIFLGFHECEVEIDLTGGAFRARLSSERLPEAWRSRVLTGRHGRDLTHMASGLSLASEG